MDVGQGTAQTDATPGTQSSVAHGLGVVPQFILITARGAGVVYLSADADATNFYVKSGGSAIQFDWRALA